MLLAMLVIYVLASHGIPPWTYLLLPLLVAVQVVGMIGLGYALAAIGVFFKDVKDLVQVFSVAGLYLTPALYLPEFVPATFRPILYLNPFSHLIWCYQDLLYFGRFEHPWSWIVFPGLSVASFIGGFRLFRAMKPVFGNAL
jgi:lipopolysaccharide transport system permease protein